MIRVRMVRVRARATGGEQVPVVARGPRVFVLRGTAGEREGNRGGPRGRSSRAEDDASVRSLGGFAIDGCARGQIGGGQRLDSTPNARGGARPNQINRPSSGVSWCLIFLERRSTEDFRDGSHVITRITKSFARVSSHEIVKIEEARLRSAHAGFCFGFRVTSDSPTGSSRAFGNPHRGSRNRRRSPRPG